MDRTRRDGVVNEKLDGSGGGGNGGVEGGGSTGHFRSRRFLASSLGMWVVRFGALAAELDLLAMKCGGLGLFSCVDVMLGVE